MSAMPFHHMAMTDYGASFRPPKGMRRPGNGELVSSLSKSRERSVSTLEREYG